MGRMGQNKTKVGLKVRADCGIVKFQGSQNKTKVGLKDCRRSSIW